MLEKLFTVRISHLIDADETCEKQKKNLKVFMSSRGTYLLRHFTFMLSYCLPYLTQVCSTWKWPEEMLSKVYGQ